MSTVLSSARHAAPEHFESARGHQRPGQLIQELFEQQAERSAAAVAVVCESESLTYGELNARANQLARHLRELGVGPGRLVGIYLERGPSLVVGLLAILKAGGAYVPLDPLYPTERVAYMIEDAAPHVVLMQESVRARLPTSDAALVTLDSDASRIAAQRTANLRPAELDLRPDHLAYVIYTSGSTGRPKGVMIDHFAVVNFLCSMQKRPGISATDRLLAVTTVAFDIAALEIYLPLVSGATVVLAGEQVLSEADRLMELLDEHDISIMQATPATWKLLLHGGWAGRKGLKALCGGEAISAELSRALLERVASCWNMYGPTETTIWSCARQIVAAEETQPVEPVGDPIENTRIYILDEQQRPVPVGMAGEIYIAGAGLARGYRNRPELTAERFLPDPFTTDAVSDARMYKTGDRGRWREDGAIAYLGRTDHQLKIRGYRIEPGEIEAALARHAAVREAVVVASEDPVGEKRLVSYLVPRSPSASPTFDELRGHLASTLPEYMVPSVFVVLERFPLTPNGKLDRNALRAPDPKLQLRRQFEAPQGEVEQTLAGIWQSLLGVEAVGRDDDFFAIGGNSLVAVRMSALLEKSLGTVLPSNATYENRTVASLATALRRASVNGSPALEPTDKESVEATFPQKAMLMQPSQISFNRCTASWISGPLNEGAFERALTDLMQRHDALRATFMRSGASVQMRCAAEVPSILQTIDVPQGDGESLERLVLDEVHRERRRPFDLERGPLARALLIRVSPVTHVFVFTVHHTVADEWSLNTIKRDLAATYAAEVSGRSARKPLDQRIRFLDFAQWQSRLHATDEYRRQFAFWEAELGAIQSPATGPEGQSRVESGQRRTEYLDLTVPDDLERRIRTPAAQRGCTPYAVLMTALQLSLAAHSQSEQQVVWSPISRRTRAELEDCVGMFTNLIVIATRAVGALSLEDYLATVVRKISRAQANADVSVLTALMRNPALMPRTPMVGLNFMELPNACTWQLLGAEVVPIELRADDIDDMCALEVMVRFTEGKMTITCASDPAVFPSASTEMIGRRLLSATELLLCRSQCCVGDLLRSWREGAGLTDTCS